MTYGPGCPECGGELRLELQPVKDEEGTTGVLIQVLVCSWCGRVEECPK